MAETETKDMEEIIRTVEQIAAGRLDVRVKGVGTSKNVRKIADGINLLAEKLTDITERTEQKIRLRTLALRSVNDRLLSEIQERHRIETELVQAKERAESADIAKSEFLAVISHEIRTPMNGVIGMTDILLGTSLDQQQKNYVNNIRLSGEHLLSIINEILDFSMIEAGQLTLEEQKFDLRSCVEDVMGLFTLKALEKNTELLHMVATDVPAYFTGDVTKLRQIIVNLVDNAVKFTKGGEICLFVTRLASKEGRHSLQFVIKDTGEGIRQDKLKAIFSPFSQGDASSSRKYEGTGLGLAICAKLVDFLGGTIQAQSRPAHGATFVFNVKMKEFPGKAPRHLSPHPKELSGKSILIVTENLKELNILAKLCRHWGMRTQISPSRTNALKKLESGEQFDVVILSVGAEKINSQLELLPQERPTILMTPTSIKHGQWDTDRDNVTHLTKPLRQSIFFDALLETLNQHALRPKQEGFLVEKTKLSEYLPLEILVAEDNVINQMVVREILKGLGYSAKIVTNGMEALDALEQQNYDIVFMDIFMPEMDGIQATRRIRSGETIRRQPKIIAMTANALKEDREKCLAAGMDDYVSKPISSQGIGTMIERWGISHGSEKR